MRVQNRAGVGPADLAALEANVAGLESLSDVMSWDRRQPLVLRPEVITEVVVQDVAIERVSGTLHGRSGTFVLQHSGTMTRGAPQLTITVVPDSGTGELAGLAGRMTIIIAGGKHSYDLEYTLAEPERSAGE
jgi:hypothetical protein